MSFNSPHPGKQAVAFLDGDYVPLSEARVPIYDLGIVQGATVTERLRTIRHRPYMVAEHLSRLRQSLHGVGWKIPGDLPGLEEVVGEISRRNSGLIAADQDFSIVICVTAGQALGDAFGLVDKSRATVCVSAAPLPLKNWARAFQEGAQLVTPKVRQPPANVLSPQIKHRSRLHWYVADHQAREETPEGMAVLLDQQGHLTETASGNLVIVRRGELATPPFGQTLAGIAREHVRQLAAKQGWPMCEADLTAADAAAADEAFLTSSTYCMLPVGSINGRRIGSSIPGPVTKMLLDCWSEEVGLDLEGQILSAAE